MARKKAIEVKDEVKTAKVISNVPLNIRQAPGLDAKIIGHFQPGDKVEVLEDGEIWVKIKGGYLMRQYLKF
jgi:uncharacterized protein YgiM (DUF1202 family)